MRRFLITLAILVGFIAAGCATWIFGGRQLSLFIDRYKTIEIASSRINSIAYEGGGTAGILTVNDLRLSLNDVSPKISLSIGSTKDNQFALASGGKVVAFGPLPSAGENAGYDLATVPQAGDDAVFETRRSAVSWPTPFDLNLMTGQSPSWKRHLYYRLRWKKPSGATLEMLWRYEQDFYSANGWGSGFMTHQGATGLIQVEIHL
jgi:hypothetical protein